MGNIGFLFEPEAYKQEERPRKKQYDDLPAGNYSVMMMRSEVKTTPWGDREVAARYKVLTGEHKDRLLFVNYTLESKNELKQTIGRGQLSNLSKACFGSYKSWQDSSDFHGIPIDIDIYYAVSKKNGKRYLNINTHAPCSDPSLQREVIREPVETSGAEPWIDDDIPY